MLEPDNNPNPGLLVDPPGWPVSGPDGEDDVAVWGQDRLWLIAAEIRRRAALTGSS